MSFPRKREPKKVTILNLLILARHQKLKNLSKRQLSEEEIKTNRLQDLKLLRAKHSQFF